MAARTEAQRPILLVCEEAHRYVPKDENSETSQAVRKILERIAKEGRKYGVSLGLITQRPSDLAEGVLSQCGTIISMRLNNDRDQACVRAAMPEGARGFLDAIPALRNRECIVCGEGVSIPIRVSFDDLERDRCPASSDPLSASVEWAPPCVRACRLSTTQVLPPDTCLAEMRAAPLQNSWHAIPRRVAIQHACC